MQHVVQQLRLGSRCWHHQSTFVYALENDKRNDSSDCDSDSDTIKYRPFVVLSSPQKRSAWSRRSAWPKWQLASWGDRIDDSCTARHSSPTREEPKKHSINKLSKRMNLLLQQQKGKRKLKKRTFNFFSKSLSCFCCCDESCFFCNFSCSSSCFNASICFCVWAEMSACKL